MSNKAHILNQEVVEWQNDLALLRSFMAHVPWDDEQVGKGNVKVLDYDEVTGAGAYLFCWPEGYDPFEAHAHGGNEHIFIIEGELQFGDKICGPGTYVHVPKDTEHGPFVPGKDGSVFLAVVDGPLFSESYIQELMTGGKAARHRDERAV